MLRAYTAHRVHWRGYFGCSWTRRI